MLLRIKADLFQPPRFKAFQALSIEFYEKAQNYIVSPLPTLWFSSSTNMTPTASHRPPEASFGLENIFFIPSAWLHGPVKAAWFQEGGLDLVNAAAPESAPSLLYHHQFLPPPPYSTYPTIVLPPMRAYSLQVQLAQVQLFTTAGKCAAGTHLFWWC